MNLTFGGTHVGWIGLRSIPEPLCWETAPHWIAPQSAYQYAVNKHYVWRFPAQRVLSTYLGHERCNGKLCLADFRN